ncbi:MAG: porin [Polyangiaceae bacterium]
MSARGSSIFFTMLIAGRAMAQPVDPPPPAPLAASPDPANPAPSPTPPAPSPPGSGPTATPEPPKAAPAAPPKEVPFDAFTASPDDPRVPNFLRALRLGKDSLLLGGYIQPGFRYVTDTEFNNDDTDGFEFQNARLIGRGETRIYSKLGAEFRFDFDVNNGNFSVRDVYGSLTWDKDLIALDLGQFKVPFGLASIQPESKLQFPIPASDRRITFDRELGAALRSWIPIKDVHIGATAMVGNGEGGFRQRRNLDGKFMVAGRVEVDPLGRMELDEPDLENRKFQFAVGANVVYNAALGNELGLNDVGAGEVRVGGDARFFFRGASLRGEYLHGFRETHGSEAAFQRYAFSIQAGYVLPIPIPLPKFELVARIAQFDVNESLDGTEGDDYVVDNTETRILQFGANVYVAKHAVKFHFLYQLTDLVEGPRVDSNGDVLIGDAIFIGSQFGWL